MANTHDSDEDDICQCVDKTEVGHELIAALEEAYTSRPQRNFKHFVFEDLATHWDYTWYIQPYGFIRSVALFPSLVLCGLFTTIQESSLLDIRMALKNNDMTYIATRFERLKTLEFKTLHMQKTIGFIESMAEKDFMIKVCPQDSTKEDHLRASIVYYKRYFMSAIGSELYIRNPLKYDSEFPTTGLGGKMTVAGLSAALMVRRFIPALQHMDSSINARDLYERYKQSTNAVQAATKAVYEVAHYRLGILSFSLRNHRVGITVCALWNVHNVVLWGLERRE
jgi:hypothetical protein